VRDGRMFGAIAERGKRGGAAGHGKLVQFAHFLGERTCKGSCRKAISGHLLADGQGGAPFDPIGLEASPEIFERAGGHKP
jgi:hypothetical protein